METGHIYPSFAILILGVILLGILLLIIGIVIAIAVTRKEKKEHIRVTAEAKKIDALVASGRITADEARELKQALGPVAYTESSREPDVHIKALGIINIVFAVLHSVLLLVALMGFGILNVRLAHVESGGIVLLPMLIMLFVVIVVLAIIIFRIIAAVKLMKGAPWTRIVIIVFSILGIIAFPIGTAIGIYALWVLLFREEAGLYFISDNKE